MSPEEVRDAQRKILTGILLKDGTHRRTSTNFDLNESEYGEWFSQVHVPALEAGLFVDDNSITQWAVTEKGKKFLLEE